MDYAQAVKKNFQHHLSFILVDSKFLLRGGGGNDFHSEDYHFVCASYRKNHVLSPVIMLLWNFLFLSAILMRSQKMLMFLFVQAKAFEVLNVDKQGACSTHYEYCDSFLQKFYPHAVWFTDFPLSLLTIYYTHTTFASFFDVDG
jgi:hypothetical protein